MYDPFIVYSFTCLMTASSIKTSLSKLSKEKSNCSRNQRSSSSIFHITKSLAWRIYIRCSEQTRSSSSTSQIITPKGNGLIGTTSSTYLQPCNQITYGSSLSMLIGSVWPVKVKCSRVSQSRWLNIGRSSWRPCLIYPVSNSSYPYKWKIKRCDETIWKNVLISVSI